MLLAHAIGMSASGLEYIQTHSNLRAPEVQESQVETDSSTTEINEPIREPKTGSRVSHHDFESWPLSEFSQGRVWTRSVADTPGLASKGQKGWVQKQGCHKNTQGYQRSSILLSASWRLRNLVNH